MQIWNMFFNTPKYVFELLRASLNFQNFDLNRGASLQKVSVMSVYLNGDLFQ